MAYNEHFEVLKALEAKDAENAQRLIGIHIKNGADFVISDIERRQNQSRLYPNINTIGPRTAIRLGMDVLETDKNNLKRRLK